MKVLRWFVGALLVGSTLLACESDSGTNGGAVEAGDVAEQSDSDAASSGDSATADAALDVTGQEDTVSDGGVTADAGGDSAQGDTGSTSDTSITDDSVESDGASTPEDATVEDLVVGDGACTNDSDLAVLNEFDIAAEQMKIGQACYDSSGGPGQTGTEEVMACFVDKLTTEYGFSEGCSGCITGQIMCLQEHCMQACMSSMMSGQTSAECAECIETNGCKSGFLECSGLNTDLFSP